MLDKTLYFTITTCTQQTSFGSGAWNHEIKSLCGTSWWSMSNLHRRLTTEVTQCVHALLLQFGFAAYFDHLSILALLLGAIVHDMGTWLRAWLSHLELPHTAKEVCGGGKITVRWLKVSAGVSPRSWWPNKLLSCKCLRWYCPDLQRPWLALEQCLLENPRNACSCTVSCLSIVTCAWWLHAGQGYQCVGEHAYFQDIQVDA